MAGLNSEQREKDILIYRSAFNNIKMFSLKTRGDRERNKSEPVLVRYSKIVRYFKRLWKA